MTHRCKGPATKILASIIVFYAVAVDRGDLSGCATASICRQASRSLPRPVPDVDRCRVPRRDPVHRRWHYDELTFPSVYAYTENVVMPLSVEIRRI
jgi:hypothetical protein